VSFQPTALVFPAVQVNSSVTRSFTMTNNGSSLATITLISIGGPSRHDFSVLGSDLLAAYRGSKAVHPAAQTLPCHRRVPHAQTCTITVVFTPTAPGSRTAELRIDLASPLRPRDIALSGTSTIAPPPPPSSSISVTHVSPARGSTAGGTSVTITGSGFTAPPADTGVSFGGAAAQFTIDSGTQITATSPSGTGTVHITVTTPAGTSTATAADLFTYTATRSRPAITSLNATTFTVGTKGTFTVTTTGSPTPSISETGTLPSGVTFADNGNGTATLSATPNPGRVGTYQLTITATSGDLPGATQLFTLTVNDGKLPFW
jgi:hypothetical protein